MKKKILQYLIPTLGISILATLILWLTYGFDMTYTNISNSLFIISITVFFISLIIQTGATRAVLGINYTTRLWFQPNKTKEKYDSYKEYYDEKAPEHKKDVLYVIIVSAIFIVISLIFALI